MTTIQVRLSLYQRDELTHKLHIMREGFDDDGNVQDGYRLLH